MTPDQDPVSEYLRTVCGSDPHLLACTASAWSGAPGRCRWCDGELTGRRTRWCSDDCVGWYARNHWWSTASKYAKARDDHRCLDCGAAGADYGIGPRGLEVHHVVPILGKHNLSGCWHHLDGLRTLCKPCHLEAHVVLRALELGPVVDQLAFGI